MPELRLHSSSHPNRQIELVKNKRCSPILCHPTSLHSS